MDTIRPIFPYYNNEQKRIRAVAQIVHYANMGYCVTQNLPFEKWEGLDIERVKAIENGIQFVLENPDCTPKESHENWVKVKMQQGWTYAPGHVNREKKTHACIRPWEQLTEIERMKDCLFLAIVKVFINGAPIDV